MKKFAFAIVAACAFSLALMSFTSDNSTTLEEVQNCFLIDACGQEAQWCDGGFHPPLMEYVEDLADHFC